MTTPASEAFAGEVLVFGLVDVAAAQEPDRSALPDAADFGLDATTARLATHVLLEPDRVFEREVLGRSGGLSGARAAFFDGEYAEASELLHGWLRAFADDPWVLALHEDLAARALDALLTLVRTEVELGRDAEAQQVLARVVGLFPTAQLAPTQYPAWLLTQFVETRDALDTTAQIDASDECTATIHGLPSPAGQVTLSRDGGWVRWDCGGRKSRLYRLDPGDSLTYPESLDTALRLHDGTPWLAGPLGDPASLADAMFDASVLLGAAGAEGWAILPDESLLIVRIDIIEGAMHVVAARGTGEPEVLRECARSGDCPRAVERWTAANGWPPRAMPARSAGVAAATTSGLAVGAAVAMEIALRGALDRVDRCAASATCLLNGSSMDQRRSRAERLRLGATAAWITAGAALSASLVALVPAWERRGTSVAPAIGPDRLALTIRIRPSRRSQSRSSP